MKRKAFFCARLALLLAAGQAAGQAAVTTQSGLTVTDLSFGPNDWTHGTVERRFLLENPSPARRTVTIELPGHTGRSSGYAGAGLHSLSGTVTLEAGAKAVLSLVQPAIALVGDATFAVEEKGAKRETFQSQAKDFQGYSSHNAASVLLSKGLSVERLTERLSAFAHAESGHLHRSLKPGSALPGVTRECVTSLQPLRLEREPAAWPSDWLAYAGFDGCMLALADYEKMPEEVRNGLRAYVAAGGQVTFLGAASAPPGWSEPDSVWRRVAGPDFQETAYGFGRVQFLGVAELPSLSSNQVVSLVGSWVERRKPWAQAVWFGRAGVSGRYAFNKCMEEIPVQGGMKVSVNLFLFTLLAFVLLAGPGAVIYTCRANRRIWLLALVPAFSLVFSVAIFVFALLSEGVTPYVRRQAVTLLDQTRRQAVTLGALAVYAPAALGGGLEFDRCTEVTPLAYSGEQEFKSIVWGRCQHFAEGWVRPRIVAFFRVRRSEERSERLVVTERGEGGVEVVNALGAPIRRLRLRDSRGGTYGAENVAPGEKRVLTAQAQASAAKGKVPALEKVSSLYQSAAPGWELAPLLEVGAALPQPGPRSYVAVLDGCPFIENPLRYRKVKESAAALVAGRY